MVSNPNTAEWTVNAGLIITRILHGVLLARDTESSSRKPSSSTSCRSLTEEEVADRHRIRAAPNGLTRGHMVCAIFQLTWDTSQPGSNSQDTASWSGPNSVSTIEPIRLVCWSNVYTGASVAVTFAGLVRIVCKQ